MELIDAWVSYYETNDEQYSWASEDVIMMTMFGSAEEAWQFINEALPKCENKKNAFFNLAAGPLENFLSKHGKEYLDTICIKTREDSLFRQLIRGVWTSGIDQEVCRKIEKALSKPKKNKKTKPKKNKK